jgi:hypothetical protein
VDSVHGSWTNAGHGPRWTDHLGQPQTSTELGRVAAPRHGGPPEVACNGERGAQGVHLGPHRGDGGSEAVVRWW